MLHNNTYLVFAIRFLKTETLQFMFEEMTISFTTPLCTHHHWSTNFCKCFLCYCSTCCGNTLFHVFHCYWNLLVHHIFHISPEKKSKGLRSGDRAGNLWTGLPRPIHQFGNCWFSAFHEQGICHADTTSLKANSAVDLPSVQVRYISRIACTFTH